MLVNVVNDENLLEQRLMMLYVVPCGHMVIYVGECEQMVIFVGECRRIMVYVFEYGRMKYI
jgi:hypothetical protein